MNYIVTIAPIGPSDRADIYSMFGILASGLFNTYSELSGSEAVIDDKGFGIRTGLFEVYRSDSLKSIVSKNEFDPNLLKITYPRMRVR